MAGCSLGAGAGAGAGADFSTTGAGEVFCVRAALLFCCSCSSLAILSFSLFSSTALSSSRSLASRAFSSFCVSILLWICRGANQLKVQYDWSLKTTPLRGLYELYTCSDPHLCKAYQELVACRPAHLRGHHDWRDYQQSKLLLSSKNRTITQVYWTKVDGVSGCLLTAARLSASASRLSLSFRSVSVSGGGLSGLGGCASASHISTRFGKDASLLCQLYAVLAKISFWLISLGQCCQSVEGYSTKSYGPDLVYRQINFRGNSAEVSIWMPL